MKSKMIPVTLFAATAATVVLYPAYDGIGAITKPPSDPVTVVLPAIDPVTNQRPLIEVVFALDTTGSMSNLIEAAKEKIWSIATTMAQAENAPRIRMGLVAYRDRGDSYVTRVVDLSADLDSMYATLMDFEAGGGGDGPESVNQALHDAVNGISWSQEGQAYQVIFLVGDAPPHMDYQDDVKYPDTLVAAKNKGIVVNTIQAGASGVTRKQWKRIAALGTGDYFRVDQSGNAVAIATPFDRKMAELSAKLDDTRLYYGTEKTRLEKETKVKATEKLHAEASVESRARRAAFNASTSGKENLFGDDELVDAVGSGRVDLDELDGKLLPEPLQAMVPEERKAVVNEKAKRRNVLRQEMAEVTQQRKDYLSKKVEELGGARDSLDHKIYRAVREQAAASGLTYEAEAPAY
ncbi:MAG: vWA domain-containing protein [Pseudomonadota bacterium]